MNDQPDGSRSAYGFTAFSRQVDARRNVEMHVSGAKSLRNWLLK